MGPRPARRLRRLDRAQPELDRKRREDRRRPRPGRHLPRRLRPRRIHPRAPRAPGTWSARSGPGSPWSRSSPCSRACTPPGSRRPTRPRSSSRSGRERLSYPLNYWNALAALIAVGLPLMLQVATGARSIAVRALAAAAMPAMVLAAFFTLSRGGIAAGFALARGLPRLHPGPAAEAPHPSRRRRRAARSSSPPRFRATRSARALTSRRPQPGQRDAGDHDPGLRRRRLGPGGDLLALAKGMRPRWAHVSQRQSLAAVLVGASSS